MKTADALNTGKIDAEQLLSVMDAILKDVEWIYTVNCKTWRLTVIRQDKEIPELFHPGDTGSYRKSIEYYIDSYVYGADREQMAEQLEQEAVLGKLRKNPYFDFSYRLAEGVQMHRMNLRCIRIGEADSFESFVMCGLSEITVSERSSVLRELETDKEIGVYSKQAFYRLAEAYMGSNPGVALDLVVTDIDNFSVINRTYGKNGGRKLLKYLADRYKEIAVDGICASLGGDQFVLLTESSRFESEADFAAWTEQVRADAPLPYIFVHYGVDREIDRADTVTDMCDKAFMAMQSKKKTAGTPVIFYNSRILQKKLDVEKIEGDFERSLASNEFVVFCQPKYNTFSKRLTSAEALVRWKTADGHFISPGEFIPIFEADGQIVKLDEYVFRTVCERQKKLLDSGEKVLPISVNMSRATLYHAGEIQKYKEIAAGVGVPKELVPLELTESATVDNGEIVDLIQQLKDAGFFLHMDDFGAGFSCLSGLCSLPFDVLKLDKSLIDGIGNKRGDEILRHIIELVHFCQMEVVAEGVETDEQYHFLSKLSCDTIQGYYFGKPVPFETYLELLKNANDGEAAMMNTELLEEESKIGTVRMTNDVKMQYLSAIASIYMTMHVIDLKEDTVGEFATTTNVKEHVNQVHNAPAQMRAAMTATVAPEHLKAALEFTDLNTVAGRMRGKRTVSAEFIGKHFGWFRARFIAVTVNEKEEPEKIIYTTQVIESDKRKEEMLIRACRTDELTGVFNRRAFEEDLKKPDELGWKECRDLAVMSVSVHGLTLANTRYGHAAGDELIWGTADCLNKAVGKDGRIYRMENNRFVAVFFGDKAKIEEISEKYRSAAAGWVGNFAHSLPTSFGAASRLDYPDAMPDFLGEEAFKNSIVSKSAEE